MPNGGCRQLGGTTNLQLQSQGAVAARVPAPEWVRPTEAQPIVLPPLTGGSREVIQAWAKKVIAIYVVDDSGSEYGSFGDPTGIRYAAAKSLIALQRQSGGGLAGCVHWGSDAPLHLVTRPVDVRKERRTLDRALHIPPTLGGNDMPGALRRAAEILPPLHANEIPLIFVISDGIEYVTSATHDAVAALPPGSVHVLLVDRSNGCTPDMELAWATVAFGSFTRLTTLDTKAAASELGQVYANALGLTLSIPVNIRRKP
jgi:hypothetical protein